MISRKSIYVSVIASLVVSLVAGFIWLTRPIPTAAANDLIKLKTVGPTTKQKNIFSRQAPLNTGSNLALPFTLPSKQPLIQGIPVITVTKSSVNEDGNPLRPGERITYTITISNSGSVSATNVVVSDTFPTNTNFILNSISITPSLAGGTPGTQATQPVIASGITVTAGSLVTVTYAVTVSSPLTDGTEIVNTASITSIEVATPTTSIVTDTVTTEADLSISKTNGQNVTVPGESTTYTIIVSNTGPSDATGAIVTDTFPTALTGITWTCSSSGGASCSASGSNNISDTVNLPAEGSLTYSATGTVGSSTVGTLVNTAFVSVPTGVIDPTPGNNSAADTDTLTPEADIRITKAYSPDPVFAGNTLTYDITIFNDGPSDATGVVMTDTLPAGVALVSAVPSQGSCSGTINVICDIGIIASSDNITVSIKVNVDPSWSGTVVNVAWVSSSVFDPNTSNDNTIVSTAVQRRTDLAISKTESSDPVALGESIIYTLNITNIGPSNATGVVVTDNLPGTVDFVSVTPTPECSETGGTVTCNLGNLPKQGMATVTIIVDPQGTGTLNNTAKVEGNEIDSVGGNNSDSESTTVNRQADLSVSKISTPNPVLPDEELTYNITVTNNGPSDALGVTLIDNLPGGVAYVSAVPSQGNCSGPSTVTCNLGSLASGNNATVEIKVNVDSLMMGTLINTATVFSSALDPNSSNNTDTENTIVGDFKKVYLPIFIYPGTTELSIHNDNTGGNITFSVIGTSVSCMVPNNAIQFCGSFPAGTYTVQAIAPCGTLIVSKTYDPGPVTTRIFCQ